MPYSTFEAVDQAHQSLRRTFRSGKTKSLAWRKWQLKQVWWLVSENEERVAAALNTDLHRHEFESHFMDIKAPKQDVLFHLSKLEEWMTDEVPNEAGVLFGQLCRARIRREPLGVALVLSAWNFPFAVLLQPLIAAISAGCCVMLKPSEMAGATQDLLVDLVREYLDPEAIQIVTAGPKETGHILELHFDQIFYTGSPKVGQIIQSAAAKHLTPTVLELGGQCPCIVTKTANIELAAKRIAFVKYLNAGQICLAPNHVFIDPSVSHKFIDRATFWITEFLKTESKSHLVRIINDQNYDRIANLLANTKGNIVAGGKSYMDKASRTIPPTLIKDVNMEDSTMSQEIFGPLLPVLIADWETACSKLQDMEYPLAIYIFSNNQPEIDAILSRTNSGGVTINDVLFHAAVPNAPFGGVGNSGTGAYHGRYGFEAFSHRRTVVTVPSWFEYLVSFKYPPYRKVDIPKIGTATKPGFKKGETMADQVVENSTWRRAKGTVFIVGKRIGKWALVAVVLALVDARFGGQPRLLNVLRDSVSGMKSRFPLA